MIYAFNLNLNSRYSVSLVLSESDRGIDSLKQLAFRKQVTPTTIGGSSFEEYFKVNSTDFLGKIEFFFLNLRAKNLLTTE